MKNKYILISGAGIAGLALAFWLKKYGFYPTIVDTAPRLREGGYMIDFWGVGFDTAEKMQMIPQLEKEHYPIPEIVFVDELNNRKGGFNIFKLRKLVNFRHFNLLRGSLAKVIYQSVEKDVEFIWDNSIAQIHQSEDAVNVRFKSGEERKFDLLVGADGLHSNVRQQIFGDELQFEKFLGYYTASFTIDNYLGKDNIFYSYSVPGKQIGIYSIADNKLSTFFIFRQDKISNYDHHDIEKSQHMLSAAYKDIGWECPTLLAKMHTAPDFYFDVVSQIAMDRWSAGRVALLGDACQCVSLISGQGSALAMAGAYVLAGELKHWEGNIGKAFANYQAIMQPEIVRKQKMAQGFASSFVPDTKFGLWMRDTFTNLMFLPLISKWFIKQFMSDKLHLPAY